MVLLPSIVLFAIYGRLIRRLWMTNHIAQSTDLALLKSRRKLTKLAVIATVLFLVCWLPYCISSMWWCTGIDRPKILEWFERFSILFVVIYTGICPIFYAVYNEAVVKEVLRKCCGSSLRRVSHLAWA